MTTLAALTTILLCTLIAQHRITRAHRNRRNDNARMLRAINRSHGGHIK